MENKVENIDRSPFSENQEEISFEKNRRILIVDDNPEIHEDFRMILGNNSADQNKSLNETKAAIFGEVERSYRQESFELDSAYQGREGVEKVRQAIKEGRPYAMAIVDTRMPPGLDGIETVKQIWKEQPDLQIVICTAYSDYAWDGIIGENDKTDHLLILKKPFDNIEVYQLASALTKKWTLEKHAQLKQKELEDIVKMRTNELIIANSELKEALVEAKAASKTKSQFLANMSHEIRTPMNGIIGFSELLIGEKLTEQQQEYVGYIKECSQNLLEIINDILDFSKIEAGKMKIEITDYSLRELFTSLGSLMKHAATKKGLDFEILQNTELPAMIRTDPIRLQQCLINLVTNAVKFTEKGFVHVTVSLLETDNKPYIGFDVEDSGIGIPPEKQEMIFASFMQADGRDTRKYGGTGLGLAITKRLTSLLGGQLTLSSEVGKGSLFSLVVPAGVDVRSQPMLDRHSVADQIKTELDPDENIKFYGKILVAEDSKTNQILAKSLLEKMGFAVTIAEDGRKALDKVLNQKFDLIFMDMQMPNLNGYDTTRILRERSIETPIIALTAYAMKGDNEKCISAGCDDYLAKPIDNKKLITIIQKYCTEGNKDLKEKIDSIKSEVDELSHLYENGNDTTSELPKLSFEGDVLDHDSLMENCGNDEELAKKLITVFFEDSTKYMELIEDAVKAKNTKDIELYAHTLKGAAVVVAATSFSDTARKLENAASNNDLGSISSILMTLKTEFTQLEVFVSQLSGAGNSEI